MEKKKGESILITITNVVKSNDKNKTYINYIIEQSEPTPFMKGYVQLRQSFEGVTLFEKIKDEDIGVELPAEYLYVPRFNGQADMKLVDIYDSAGDSLLS